MAGQTINDRLLAAKHSIAGQGLAKSVCKATTEELLGPKKKHLDYLVHCTNEPNVSIPQLANLLIERSQNSNWIVVYKSLITTHHILCYGNERFTQYLASSNTTFQLNNFMDKTTISGAPGASLGSLPTGGAGAISAMSNLRTGYDMSPFIRRYARYLNEKALSYRTVAFDFCKVKRGKEEGTLRTMPADKLLKTLPVLQQQLDTLLEFDCTANDLTNGVINMCFMLLFRDLIRLFAGYNDAIINLLEKYFEMNKKQCREALDLYKKFLIRMDRVGEFLKVAENIGIDKGDIPDLTKAPNSLLDALEQHLQSLEGGTPTAPAGGQKHGPKITPFTTAATNETQQAVAEEEAILNQYKAATNSTNPFLEDAAPAPPAANNTNQQILDLFGTSTAAPVSAANASSKASDDLLQLGNPFADMFAPTTQPQTQQTDLFSNSNWTTAAATNGDTNLISVFDSTNNQTTTSMFDDPMGMLNTNNTTMLPTLGGAPGGQQPMIPNLQQQTPQPVMGNAIPQQKKVLTGDLESSLMSLCENLTISNNAKPSAVQWNSPKNQPKPTIPATGGFPQPAAGVVPPGGANYRPMMPAAAGAPMQFNPAAGGSPRMIPPTTNQQPKSDSLFDPFGDL